MQENKLFIKAEEIADEMGMSKPYAYKLVRKLNKELSEQGFCGFGKNTTCPLIGGIGF